MDDSEIFQESIFHYVRCLGLLQSVNGVLTDCECMSCSRRQLGRGQTYR